MLVGKSIRIYLADSTVTGIRYAELVNWTGQAIAFPRNRLADLADWPEAQKPGVYFLFEARLGDSKPMAYIGESENVAERISSHDRKKEFWNEVVFFTSKDENLTKAHVKFLESALAELSTKADRYELENGNSPTESRLPRADLDAMAEFIENIRMVLGTLGYPILEPLLRQEPAKQTVVASSSLVASPGPAVASTAVGLVFEINHLIANGAITDEGFVIKKGSQLSLNNSESLPAKIARLKDQLVKEGRLIRRAGHYELMEDYLISSSSYAAALVAGTNRSGPQSWFSEDGRSLKEIEDNAIRESTRP